MINMLAKAQKSWAAKAILTLTALSFMSLFGVSGYLSSAGKNRPVIKVDNMELSQGEFQYLLQREQNAVRGLLGDDFDEDDNVRAEMIQKIANREVMALIVDRTAKKYDISISDAIVQSVIFSLPQFQIDGKYSPQLMKTFLSKSGVSDAEYIRSIRRDIERQILLGAALNNFYPPKILSQYLAKMTGQKRVFEYVTIDEQKLPIERKISDDEVEQYYSDFAPDFVEPERRDADFIIISNDDVMKSITVDDDEIETYYQDNIADYETPETREVLQIMFDDEQSANKAYFELKSGKDFYAVAKDMLSQSKEDTDFGNVSKDMLIDELKDEVFALPSGGFSKPISSENGWHIVKVAKIVPMHKMDRRQARRDIVAKIKEDKLYDNMYEFVANIEDKFGAGESLENVAKQMGYKLYEVKGLAEDGTYAKTAKSTDEIVKSPDFIDTMFSYNIGEVSQALETERGFVIVSVKNIEDSRPKTVDEVRGQIEKMWAENERAVIAQEIVNDVMHDLENGDNLKDIAARFNLKYVQTKPLSRGEQSGDLTVANVMELFHEQLMSPKVLTHGKAQTIVQASSSKTEAPKLSANETAMIESNAAYAYSADMANRIMNDFARDYDVRVKYRLMGLQD